MTTATQTTEDIVRALAERRILCPKCQGAGFRGEETAYVACPRDIPDPRFEALWCKHDHSEAAIPSGDEWCDNCGDFVANSPKGIDASAGALLRAVQASGFEISLTFVKAPPQNPFLRDTWLAVWPLGTDNTKIDHAYADTPEEALARALTGATDWCW